MAMMSRSVARWPRPGDAVAGELVLEVRLAQAEGLELELGIALEVVEAERIEHADGVAEVAVGLDQRVDLLLLVAPGMAGLGLGGGGGRRGSRRALGRAVEAQVETSEEELPVAIDAGAVLLPALVHLFELGEVGRGAEAGRNDHRWLLCG